MITLCTGLPGASKTLNTIKMVREDKMYQGREVYYFGIAELSPEFGWIELTKEEAINWWDLPDGSVIIFDEVYKLFPLRGPSKEPPFHVAKMAEHRHKGFDFILIAQAATGQFDSFVRKVIERHYHFERKFGTSRVVCLEFQKCCDNVEDYHRRQSAIKRTIKIDKSYFGKYKSTSINTMQSRLPWSKLAGLSALLIFVCGLFYVGFSSFASRADNTQASQQQTQQTVPHYPNPQDYGFESASYRTSQVTKEDWYNARVARVEGFAHTAPVYDDITKPVTFPRPNCVIWDVEERSGPSECRCYSQQATRMDVPPNICLQIVKHGWFDHTRPDTPEEKQYASDLRRQQAEQRPASRGYVSPDSYLINEGSHLIWQASVKN